MAPLDDSPDPTSLQVRSVFLSDIHLGYHDCKAEALLDFLKRLQCEHLYLIGDIVDIWNMRRSWFWPEAHNTVIQKILRMARHGTKVTFIPGNHDALFRQYVGLQFGGIEIVQDADITLADGRRAWLTHGDQFDTAVKCGTLLRHLGHHGYDFLLWLNRRWNTVRRMRGLPYWSLADAVKHRITTARTYIERYEHIVAEEAADRGVDVVICGHIHRPVVKELAGVVYANDGDWVENCTALVEEYDGTLELIDYEGDYLIHSPDRRYA